MDITNFLQISIVGIFLSLAVYHLKGIFETKGWVTKAGMIALSLIVAAGYVWLQSTSYFETVVTILTTASTVYALVLKDLNN